LGANEVRVLLDTAVLIFAVESPQRLSKRAHAVLKDPANIRELSTVSLTEIAIKTILGKLNMSAEIARQAVEDMDIHVLPFTADHASAPPLQRHRPRHRMLHLATAALGFEVRGL
jgi:PIN domain nuclease of toxin-antitoxin system